MSTQAAESVVGWTWQVHYDIYAYSDGGDGLKMFRTKEEAIADCRQEWYDDIEITLLKVVLIDGSMRGEERTQ